MSQALYRKWRPKLWDEVLGQEHVIQTLKNAIHSDRVGHAYLFAGPRGTGKTTTARLLAKAVNCLSEDVRQRPCNECAFCLAVNDGRFLDLIEIDAASNTSVEDIRSLRDKINFSPTQGKYKVYIIDEVHMLSTAAFNALLKTLEEPPSHAIFILATTEVHKIPATVLSRCQRHEFRRIPIPDIVKELELLAKQEKLTIAPEALTLIARQATGSMRDAISLLDQLASSGQAIDVGMAQAVLGTATSQSVVQMVDAVLDGRTGDGMTAIHTSLDSGSDPRQFARQIVDYLRGLLLIRMGNADQVDATEDGKKVMKAQAGRFSTERLVTTLRLFNSAASDLRSGWQPGLLLEMAIAEAAAPTALVEKTQPVPVPEVHRETPSPKVETPVVRQAPPPAIEPPAPSVVETLIEESKKTAAKAEKPAAKVEKPAEKAPAQPVSGGAINVQDVQQNWVKIRLAVKDTRRQTEALLNSVKGMFLKDGVLVLGFASDVIKSKMETGDNLEVTRQAIARILGKDIPLACSVVGGNITTSSDSDMDGDGMVNAALNLGGKIVHKD
ncbi:MAG: DNA polymerase III subunit gamma/tau [Anaerolineaceae bacterium]|nr:DNA polymerase III subunit gamma/tau [Anaerolineaceae bacterium]